MKMTWICWKFISQRKFTDCIQIEKTDKFIHKIETTIYSSSITTRSTYPYVPPALDVLIYNGESLERAYMQDLVECMVPTIRQILLIVQWTFIYKQQQRKNVNIITTQSIQCTWNRSYKPLSYSFRIDSNFRFGWGGKKQYLLWKKFVVFSSIRMLAFVYNWRVMSINIDHVSSTCIFIYKRVRLGIVFSLLLTRQHCRGRFVIIRRETQV